MICSIIITIFLTTKHVFGVGVHDSNSLGTSSEGDAWSYSDQRQWGGLCQTGRSQSPIDLPGICESSGSAKVTVDKALSLTINEDQRSGTLTNTGKTVIFEPNSPPQQQSLSNRFSDPRAGSVIFSKNINELFGRQASSSNMFTFEQFHFHWPAKTNSGSEHAINGVRMAAEIHLVHFNSKYGNLSEAANYNDGLLVIAIFLHLTSQDNENLKPITDRLIDIQKIDAEITLSFSIKSLLPVNQNTFYVYSGSLTTPLCEEVVTWIVFDNSIGISQTQLNNFKSLMVEAPGFDTTRNIQPRNRRIIYASSNDQCN